MTDTEIKLREMEERIKKLEDVVFDQWLSQYGYGKPNIPTNYHPECDFEHNYSWKPDDVPPYVPTQACSQEQMAKALTDYNAWVERNVLVTYLRKKANRKQTNG